MCHLNAHVLYRLIGPESRIKIPINKQVDDKLITQVRI